MKKESIFQIMPLEIKQMFYCLNEEVIENMQEIRLRIGQPVLIILGNKEYGITKTGLCKIDKSYIVQDKDMEAAIRIISGFSIYALEDELKQGYITIEGGHRVGIVGRAVIENGHIKTLRNISAMNIRIAHQVIGCSKEVLPYMISKERVYHTLIVSPPKCGKTTLLRDIVRSLSNGFSGYGPYTVGVVDERSEIAACYLGVPQNDIGPRTDVLDGCPKVEGMRILLRSMSPDILVVDEIGKREDILAIEEVLGAGISVVSTVHGNGIDDCLKKPLLSEMIREKLFERIIVLSSKRGPCTLENILDAQNDFKVLR